MSVYDDIQTAAVFAILYVDGPLLARYSETDLIRSLAPICPAFCCART